MKVNNIDNLPPEFIWRDSIGLVTSSSLRKPTP